MQPAARTCSRCSTRKAAYQQVFDLYVAHPALSFADCCHAVLAQRLNLAGIISFDRGFDRLPRVTRSEPE